MVPRTYQTKFGPVEISAMMSYERGWALHFADSDDPTTLAFITLKPSGEVDMVTTHSKYRRAGFASILWRYLVAKGERPMHSPCRYPDGDVWARAVGGHLPPLHALPCRECCEGF